MRIAFLDLSDLKYRIDALDNAPLGGSQSAMLLVADELTKAGASACVVGPHLEHGAAWRGITGYDARLVEPADLEGTDVAVSVNFLPGQEWMERLFPRRPPRLVHWHKNDVLAPYAARFARPEFTAHVDRLVFCSHFQASGFLAQGGFGPDRAAVIPNPLAPSYIGLVAPDAPVLARKDPDLLIYASAPNRGLEGLLQVIFPALRKVRPRLRLEAYSGFYLDQGLNYAYKGQNVTGRLHTVVQQASALPGVTSHPGVSKAVLAQRFREAAMLCYPTIFRETSCHVALEAMAAGCLVSSTTIGALPETSAGFGHLTPATVESFDPSLFIRTTLNALEQRDREPAETERRLRAQIDYVNRCHAPAAVGAMWQELLTAEIGRGHARQVPSSVE